MPNNYFITGLPKSGKTTLLKKLVDDLKTRKIAVGGFVSPEEKVHGTRTGFKVMDVCTGKKARLAAVNIDGPKVSKYHVDLRSFNTFLSSCMKSPTNFDVVVVDEIGRMEMKSTKFQNCLETVLESSVPLIASLHRDYIEDYKAWGQVITLTRTNAGRVYLELLRNTKELNGKPRASKKKSAKTKQVKKQKKPKKKVSKKKKPAKKAIIKKKKPKVKKPKPKKPLERPEKPDFKKKTKKKKDKPKKKGGVFSWLKNKFSR